MPLEVRKAPLGEPLQVFRDRSLRLREIKSVTHDKIAAGKRSRISGMIHSGGCPLATRWMFA